MIRVGVIGMGRSGWELHAATLKDFPGFRLVAVCDQSPARLAAAAAEFGAMPYADPSALIGATDVDLVVVAAPSNLHAALTLQALAAGKHVVVEKPMAMSLAEADAMLAAARDCDRVLAVFHNRHWDRDYHLVKKLVTAGTLGELLTVDSRVMTYGPEWTTYGVPEFDSTWRIKAAHGGGFLADWGPHLIEQVLDLVAALPVSVSAQLRSQLWAKEVEDYFSLRLAFPSGLLATIEGSNNARLPLPRWFIVGSAGTLQAEGAWGKWTEMRLRQEIAGVSVDSVPQGVAASSGSRNMDVGDELSQAYYADLGGVLQSGGSLTVTAQRARDVMAVLDAARRSHATGQAVTL